LVNVCVKIERLVWCMSACTDRFIVRVKYWVKCLGLTGLCDCLTSKHWSGVIWGDGSDSQTSSEHVGLEVWSTWTQVSADDLHWLLVYTATCWPSSAVWAQHRLSVCLLRHSCMSACVLSLMSVVTMTVVVYVLVAFIGWIRCTYVWQYGTGRRRLSVVWLVVFEAADGSTIGSGSGCAPASSSSNYATLGRPLSLPVSRQQRHLSSSDPDLATSSTTSPDSDMTTYSGQFNTCVIQCHVICSLYCCCKWIIDW